jgi:hypothetical protein
MNCLGAAKNSRSQHPSESGRKSSGSVDPAGLFAFLDSLAKVVLTCVPESGGMLWMLPSQEHGGRHARSLKSAHQALVGDAQLAMNEGSAKDGEV